jgi:hypothetical protein
MVYEYRGRGRWSEFLKALQDEDTDGLSTISPGGAATLLGVTRQRIFELLEQRFAGVRAWAFYEDDSKRASVVEVSVLDLLHWGVRVKRIQAGQELPYLGRRWEERVLTASGT